ncbi:N-terminal methylation site [Sulfuricella denitrificans skB26]|uniref:N-terminal methylation site n=1 Tax=Sulfuricella denitrificans (strain DSM 22764 / NBRC 105220 / skB26) TaxID=1163617 RepID=S6ANY5_SULDS|nr:type II secretion system protein [Sulfuricella denitrificans]BAN36614.1 N-terminal methylation site [Sulfuricella denitrificans skB26]
MARHNRGVQSRTSASGFTLIELVVTVAIVAVLASGIMPMIEVTVQRNKEQELRVALMQIRNAIDAYKKAAIDDRTVGASGYPKTLELLASGVEDIKSPTKAKIFFLRRIPRDPMSTDPSIPAAETWGKRSYASSAENPQEGNDVFDIYSLNTERGLNGISYKDW